MDEQDDLDIQLQRASRWTLPRLQSRLAQLSTAKVSSAIRPTASSIRPLEDPQQLDPCLKDMLPPLISRYLELIQDPGFGTSLSSSRQQSGEIAKILSQFCKVRGSKVVSRFLNNEPRYIEPILDTYTLVCKDGDMIGDVSKDDVEASGKAIDTEASQGVWQEAYAMLLWLGHLMLAPFDLSTISADYDQNLQPKLPLDLTLSMRVPSICMRVLHNALSAMTAADKRQSAAAALLVKLVTRPDMQKLGLLDAISEWALSRLSTAQHAANMNIHEFVGLLTFLSGIVVSADIKVTGKYLRRLFYAVTALFSEETTIDRSLTTSAVAKRVAIKIQRNIVILVLAAANESTGIDSMSILEDVIDFLLRILGDRDTQVRKAASKALSIITRKVDPEMGQEIVEAVLGSLNEDVLSFKGRRSLQSVNPLRWHGLTLTLAQMLFRRSPSPFQLPSILNALFLALGFEQRSSAGASVGGNVRDAANFGLWSLARRYTTEELHEVDSTDINDGDSMDATYSVLQLTACHLLSAACLDPVGNVRRGSSAALQELIGRHPDTIQNGISLVQIVDYHAVGLRRRATTDVAFAAGKLHDAYRVSLERDLQAWRGIGTIDKVAREFAAIGLGKLSTLQNNSNANALVSKLVRRLDGLPRSEVEDRHGLVLALSFIVGELDDRLEPKTLDSLWTMFGNSLSLTKDDFNSASKRPELTAGAVMVFIARLASYKSKSIEREHPRPKSRSYTSARISMQVCIPHVAESNYGNTVDAVRSLSRLLTDDEVHGMIQLWTRELQRSRMPYRTPAMTLALGAMYSSLDISDDDTRQYIIDTLVRIANTDQDIEAKVIAVRSIALLRDYYPGTSFCTDSQYGIILETIEKSLNDYTINRRGDVGSLLRTEALSTFARLATVSMQKSSMRVARCYLACQRLALEKLHKVRAEAAHCLLKLDATAIPGFHSGSEVSSMEVSTYSYFDSFAQKLTQSVTPPIVAGLLPEVQDEMALAILQGFSSTAGVGPDDVVQPSRAALLDALNMIVCNGDQLIIRRTTDAILALLRNSLPVERTLVPILEMLAYLLDAGILQRMAEALHESTFKWRTLLSLVQKAHFKSTSMPKLMVAVDVYRGLAEVVVIRAEVVTKLASMLMHPFPKIRVAVAETLWVLTADEALKPINLMEAALGKRFVEEFKKKHCSPDQGVRQM